MAVIGPEEFLARATVEHRTFGRGTATARLYAGVCETKEAVAELINKIGATGCAVLFEVDPKHPNCAQRIFVDPVVSPAATHLLNASAVMVNNYHPDQMDVTAAGIWFWWD